MNLHIRYFAVLRDRRGLAEESIEMAPLSARQLVDKLATQHELGLPSALIRVAVNGEFVEDDFALSDGHEIVLIPPVAGG